MTNPGEVHLHTKDELMDVDIDADRLNNILEFLLR